MTCRAHSAPGTMWYLLYSLRSKRGSFFFLFTHWKKIFYFVLLNMTKWFGNTSCFFSARQEFFILPSLTWRLCNRVKRSFPAIRSLCGPAPYKAYVTHKIQQRRFAGATESHLAFFLFFLEKLKVVQSRHCSVISTICYIFTEWWPTQ